jgi:hypothetical protein
MAEPTSATGTSNKRLVVLFDDDTERVQTWREKLEGVPGLTDLCDIEAPSVSEFALAFESLKDRQAGSRADGSPSGAGSSLDDASILDRADIVIVDFDLTPARGAQQIDAEALKTLRGSFGDTFAYLTRCYTGAGYVVLVNQTFYQSTFDLTMREFEFSAADLNVTDSDLGNEDLWYGHPGRDRFRPWHWPRLVDAGQFVHDRASNVDLDAGLLAALGFDDPEVFDLFDPQQLEVLGKGDPRAATFRTMTGPDAGFGVRSKSETPSEESLKRIAASAVTRWLERIIVPAQNILVDAPHLVQRRRRLVEEPRTIEALDQTADLSGDIDLGDVLDLNQLIVATSPASDWCLRPVWLWPKCPPGPPPNDKLVFCEDGSFFRHFDEVEEFKSELPGPFRNRFVAELHEASPGFPIEYRPFNRLYQA